MSAMFNASHGSCATITTGRRTILVETSLLDLQTARCKRSLESTGWKLRVGHHRFEIDSDTRDNLISGFQGIWVPRKCLERTDHISISSFLWGKALNTAGSDQTVDR